MYSVAPSFKRYLITSKLVVFIVFLSKLIKYCVYYLSNHIENSLISDNGMAVEMVPVEQREPYAKSGVPVSLHKNFA